MQRSGRRAAAVVLPLLLTIWAMAAALPVGAASLFRDCSGKTLAPGADLHRCDFADATIIGMDLRGINLARSDLSRVNAGCDPDQPRTNLYQAIIYRAVLVDAKLCDAILDLADLHGSDLRGAALEDAALHGTNLSWANLDGANAGFAPFDDANLSNASWVGANAPGASFDGGDLHRLVLRNADLRIASFVGSDLRYVVFDGADLSRADLTGARVNSATTYVGATFSDTTCPDGTNTDTNGGTCAGH